MEKIIVCVLFFCFFTFSKADDTGGNVSSVDWATLLHLKSSISSDPSNHLSNWNSTSDYCSWYGVTCDRSTGRVTALILDGDGLTGTLPSTIADLSELRTLSVPHNAFSGEIPESIGELRFLQVLELQGNNFSGNIPDQITNLQFLQLLNLSFNSLSGGIPRKLIGQVNLADVDLSNNDLLGAVVVDSESGCEQLTQLKLSNNYLTDNIPRDIGKCRNLQKLLLDGNILEGPIPAEIGRLSELIVVDVSRNSLTEKIPGEMANCSKLSVVVLTNLYNSGYADGTRGEFNAFDGGIPYSLLSSISLQILWAPRANLGGRLADNFKESCSLRVMNLGQNNFNGSVPESLGNCKNLTYLDLSLNYFVGYLPEKLPSTCLMYFNISKNSITGVIPKFEGASCGASTASVANIPLWGFDSSEKFLVVYDLSFNRFYGSLPMFSVGDRFMGAGNGKPEYRLSFNNNMLNGSVPWQLVSNCSDLSGLAVNLGSNQFSGMIFEGLLVNCLELVEFQAANNLIGGRIGSAVGKLTKLRFLNLGGNRVSGTLPDELGQLYSLEFLDLSHNALSGSIPASLTKAGKLETVLLDYNNLSGEVPPSFSSLWNLTTLSVSFNNLSGPIPNLRQGIDCIRFRGNEYLEPCPATGSPETGHLPDKKLRSQRQFKSLMIAVATSASGMLCLLLLIVTVIIRKKRFAKIGSVREKVMVTFADAPHELTYENVVRATGNFSIGNLIGTGGFGSTYQAELFPGYLVAVKRLSIGRFQGAQQFDAEIRTLGQIRHKNLVTLLGYYMGEAEMFLVYNYLSGGNLETFIHTKFSNKAQWSVIHKIAIDIAEALAYLHYSCVPRIVHRDIKPSNILLDDDLNAYLSDFGLARLLEVSETHATTDVAGTFGYVAPEYATTCRVSNKADVYSFGVVLLELMSGKKSLDPSFSDYGNGFTIVAWARLLIKEGRFSEIFSPALWDTGPKDSLLGLLKLASNCTVETLPIRPSVKQVLEKLKQLK